MKRQLSQIYTSERGVAVRGWRPAACALLLCLIAVAPGCDRGERAKAGEAKDGAEKAGATATAGGEPGKDEKHGGAEGSGADQVKLTESAVKKFEIKVDKASKRPLVPTITAPARVSFNLERTSHVGVPVAGRVVEVKVRLGDAVKKSDVLLVVDSPDLGEAQSDYLQKKTAAEIAGPAVEFAKNAYDRAEKLIQESQGISLTEVQKRQSELQSAQGALKTAQAAVVAAENKLHLLGMSQEAVNALLKTGEVNAKYEVRAPIAGRVVEWEVTQGELVRPDKEALVVLADLSSLWVLADVPQASLAYIPIGARARVSLGVGGGSAAEGKVSYVAPQINPSTRTASVRVELKSDGLDLRAGMFATVEIETTKETPRPVLAVPDEAVQNVEGGPAVFVPVKGEGNTFAKRAVRVGPQVGGWVPVIGGLKEGDEVVVSGSFVLKAELGKSSAGDE